MSEEQPMNLGEIVDALRLMPRNVYVRTPIGSPTSAVSYRGFYDQLALVIDGGRGTTVGDLLTTLESILEGETREGYKGGTYRYGRSTPVWLVLHLSETSSAGIVSITRGEDGVEMSIGWQRW